MKTIAVVAISKNGYITNGGDPDVAKWTSKEDKVFFKNLLDQHSLYVIGKNTYEAVKPQPSPDKLRIILTKNPEKYNSEVVKGQLEFYNLTPQEFVNKFSKYDTCLVLGGSQVYNDFLGAQVVNELYLTIEPMHFKSGIPFLMENRQLESLHLPEPEVQILNSAGTELRHYYLLP